jgi:hypothetical protein
VPQRLWLCCSLIQAPRQGLIRCRDCTGSRLGPSETGGSSPAEFYQTLLNHTTLIATYLSTLSEAARKLASVAEKVYQGGEHPGHANAARAARTVLVAQERDTASAKATHLHEPRTVAASAPSRAAQQSNLVSTGHKRGADDRSDQSDGYHSGEEGCLSDDGGTGNDLADDEAEQAAVAGLNFLSQARAHNKRMKTATATKSNNKQH